MRGDYPVLADHTRRAGINYDPSPKKWVSTKIKCFVYVVG